LREVDRARGTDDGIVNLHGGSVLAQRQRIRLIRDLGNALGHAVRDSIWGLLTVHGTMVPNAEQGRVEAKRSFR
jgi:hypothetical protein